MYNSILSNCSDAIKAALNTLSIERNNARESIAEFIKKNGTVSFKYDKEIDKLGGESRNEAVLDAHENNGVAIDFTPGKDVRTFTGFVEKVEVTADDDIVVRGFLPTLNSNGEWVKFAASLSEVETPEQLIRFIEDFA